MPTFIESSITLNFPDENYFRISECTSYASLFGNNFKEMDACWHDAAENIYWLFELKDYTIANLSAGETIQNKAWDIVKKGIDSFCMFLSNRHRYPYGLTFDVCFPFVPDNNTQFKFITIVHCLEAQKPDVQLINNAFKTKFKSYAQLFGISHYAVIEHSMATRIIPGNIVQ